MVLIAQYFFEGDLLDETVNNNDGTLNAGGTETYAAGVLGQGFSFDGSTEIALADTPFDFERTDPFSIAVWIKTTSVNVDDFIFGKNTGAAGYQMHLRTTNNEIRVRISNAGGNRILLDTVGVNVRDGEWHHIVLTYDGSSLASGVNVYVDSIASTKSVVNDTLTSSILNNTDLVIGNEEKDVTTKFFTGAMDYVGIYDNELTSVEVADLFVNEGLLIIAPKLPNVSATPATVVEGAMIRINGKAYIGDDGVWRRF